jgi:c(7)-type cytochrome triheme protein
MFLAEVLLGTLAPIVLLVIPRIRSNHFSLFVASLLVVLGFIMNRLNVSLTGMEGALGTYFPSWTEVSVTAMIVSLGFVLFATGAKYLPVFPPEESEKTQETAESQWLDPNILRQPLFSSTTMVLLLGGLFFGGALLVGGSGLRHRMQMPSVSASQNAVPPVGYATRYLAMPPEVTFPMADTSPGPVTFRHSSHLDLNQANCIPCHADGFRILKVRVPSATPAAGHDFHSNQFCGACHNGEKSFSVEEDCQLCHAESSQERQ